jgi:hypothetical protein
MKTSSFVLSQESKFSCTVVMYFSVGNFNSVFASYFAVERYSVMARLGPNLAED